MKYKQRYIKLAKLHDSTKNELEIMQYKYNNLEIVIEKGVNKPMSKHDVALHEFINTGIDRSKVASGIDRSKVASMIYHV